VFARARARVRAVIAVSAVWSSWIALRRLVTVLAMPAVNKKYLFSFLYSFFGLRHRPFGRVICEENFRRPRQSVTSIVRKMDISTVITSVINRGAKPSYPIDGQLGLIRLASLMERSRGSPELKIGLIDGPVAIKHLDLESQHLREISANSKNACTNPNSMACMHGTFVAGILSAKRGSPAPAICPDCTLLIRPIFSETTSGREYVPSATHQELAAAITECIDAGARVINLSLALPQPSTSAIRAVEEAINQAVRRGVIVVAAAGNQGTLGGSAITRHPWVIPVAACDDRGRPANDSNLSGSVGRRGLSALGARVTSLGAGGQPITLGGTSVAAPFVTGAIALLWSEYSGASAGQIKLAVTQAASQRRASVVPPLLDAEAAYRVLAIETGRSGAV
jgi:subtilisin family serine protease